MDRYSRWAELLELLSNDGRLTVETAAERLGVSQATVRRDFDALGKQRRLVRLRGAALHNAAPAAATIFDGAPVGMSGAGAIAPPHARRIAGQVASLLHPGAVVGLAGTALAAQVGHAIGVRFEASKAAAETNESAVSRSSARSGVALTVVTNDLSIAANLVRRPGLKVVTTGGVLAPHSMTLSGPLAGLLLQGISLDSVVVAPAAVDPEFGVTATDELDAEGCALMVARARQVVVAAASVDLDRSAFARICGTERVDVLVTDTGIAPATAERFANRGVRVVTA
ncbi:MAG: DeoR/GlpR family DNA-binding transcription regulator [Acidothermaceae bacterium]